MTLKRGEEVDLETLTAHLGSVGYTQVDLVEMPGQFTRRGGILDVYSAEADRPVRVEFFGDEIETIRKFDPETQRSQSGLDETQLLPLTETPLTERLLAAVNGRLSQQRVDTEDAEMAAEAAAAGGVSVFPGWEFFAAVAGAEQSLLRLVPRSVLIVDEPAMVRNQIERWWNKVGAAARAVGDWLAGATRRYLSAAGGASRGPRFGDGLRFGSAGRGGRA